MDRAPIVLFGAFDRHNFGDLLFPHVLAALLPGRELRFAGLLERDLRAFGGHRLEALPKLAHELAERPVTLVHAGGELLTCDAWQAAVMLLPPEKAREVVRQLDEHPRERVAWARGFLHNASLAPYASQAGWPREQLRIVYQAVGGVELHACDPALRDEVLARLSTADEVGVRDRRTLAHLAAAGIDARLMPDPAVMVAELFGARIRERTLRGEPARVAQSFPQGYLAVQFSADFGDDATLAAIAAQLDRVTSTTGFGVALFRAGAAPWHDEIEVYRVLASRLRAGNAAVFESLELWDLCALIGGSRGYCGSSLHGRIVAGAFALPRVNLRHPSAAAREGKQAAYCEAWEQAAMPATIAVDEIEAALAQALAADPAVLEQACAQQVARYLEGFDAQIGSQGDDSSSSRA